MSILFGRTQNVMFLQAVKLHLTITPCLYIYLKQDACLGENMTFFLLSCDFVFRGVFFRDIVVSKNVHFVSEGPRSSFFYTTRLL